VNNNWSGAIRLFKASPPPLPCEQAHIWQRKLAPSHSPRRKTKKNANNTEKKRAGSVFKSSAQVPTIMAEEAQ
jgi:hypothetical protein